MKSLMPLTHKEQLVNFRSSVFHLSAASVLFFLKEKFKSIDIAGLYELLASRLMTAPKFTSVGVNFTLVNVYSGVSGFSHGSSVPPPESARPANKQLIFTFAFDVYDSVANIKPTITLKRSNPVSQFGTVKNPTTFTCVGLTSNEVAAFGLNALYTEHIAYLYNIVGVMTKSLAKHKSFYTTGSYGEFYPHTLKALFDTYGRASLYKIIVGTPYPYWVYSTAIWTHAPNLLSSKMLTPHSVLYYFLYVHGAIQRYAPRDRVIRLLGLQGSKPNTVLGYLSESLLEFVQNINTPGYMHESALDVLAPAVIQSVVLDGTARIQGPGSSDDKVWTRLKEVANTMARAFADTDTNVGSLFTPPSSVARKLFVADESYAERLTNELDFSNIGTQ